MEPIYSFLLDIIKLAAAGALVFLLVYLVIRPLLDKNRHYQLLELKKASIEKTLPLRLQAYERLVLFVERITPANLLLRAQVPGITASELQQMLSAEIRNEYHHNVSQQLYVNNVSWEVVKKIKEDTLSLINNVARSLPPDAPGIDMSKSILSHISSLEENPYDIALNVIKSDFHKLF